MSTKDPTTLYADLPDRLTAAADKVEETYTAYQLAVRHRKQLIVTAVDMAGMYQSVVARLARVTQPTVARTLGDPDIGPVELGAVA